MNSTFKYILVAMSICGAIGTSSAFVLEPFAETPQERAMCSALVYGGTDRDSRMKLEGQDRWLHTHHYCDCIRFRYRALKSLGDRHAVSYNLGVAIGGCDYVLNAVPKDYFLRAKIHVDKGRALKLKGEKTLAVSEFQKAIQSDSREVSAYLELSELEREIGLPKQALDTVIQGLRHNPGVKTLEKSYLSLGGKEPFPEPIQKPVEPEIAKPDEPRGFPDPTAPTDTAEPTGVAETKHLDADSAPPAAAVDETQQNSGRSCRFCPPEEILQRWNETFAPERPVGAGTDKAR